MQTTTIAPNPDKVMVESYFKRKNMEKLLSRYSDYALDKPVDSTTAGKYVQAIQAVFVKPSDDVN